MDILLGGQMTEDKMPDFRWSWNMVVGSITNTVRLWNDYHSCASLQELAIFQLWGMTLLAFLVPVVPQTTMTASICMYSCISAVLALAFLVPCVALVVRYVKTFTGTSHKQEHRPQDRTSLHA